MRNTISDNHPSIQNQPIETAEMRDSLRNSIRVDGGRSDVALNADEIVWMRVLKRSEFGCQRARDGHNSTGKYAGRWRREKQAQYGKTEATRGAGEKDDWFVAHSRGDGGGCGSAR